MAAGSPKWSIMSITW